ncbi:MAG: HIRAN domain-containing protein, partial [Methanobrevibacter sp.]|nr:HIRAN domain-containing protein [Methanobrevibacter sp.]
ERKAIFIKSKLKIEVLFNRIKPHHLDLINEALKILPDDCDNGPYLNVKGDILDQLGDPVKARICRALAYKSYDEVNEVEKQLKKLKSAGTYINITGVHYYQGFTPFKEGTVVDLIREPDNQHDPFAIRVEVNGETVGYVANNRYTLIKEVKSATDIKDSNATQAKVQFILFREWVIAKLI